MKRFRFTKNERVAGEKRIESLFTQGRTFLSYPFRVVYLETAEKTDEKVMPKMTDTPCNLEAPLKPEVPMSILISIPKRKMKSAVDRNRMKRLTREAYRLNKYRFLGWEAVGDRHFDVAFICVADKPCDYATVEKGMRKAIKELNKQKKKKNSAQNN